MVFHQAVSDFAHHDAAVSAFDEAHVGIDKGKPEPQVVVLDLVQPLLALFRIILGNWNLPFQNIQVDQGLQILGQAGGFRFQNTGNGGQLCVACGNGPDDGEIAAYLADLLLQQEVRLIVQIAGPVQNALLDSTVNVLALGE